MAFSANVGLVFYVLVCLIRNTVTVNFRMERGRYDTFVNLECEKSQQCTEKQCMKYAAQCTNEECKRCRCDEEKSTFIYSNSTTAFCLKDEDIIAQTGMYTQMFLPIYLRCENYEPISIISN